MMTSRRTADITLLIVAALAVFLLGVVVYASSHAPVSRVETYIEPCAAVIERGQEQGCR